MTEKQRIIDDYLLERRVAQGGMGEIWRGVRQSTGEPVAVKRLLWQAGLQEEHTESLRARLLRESRALEQLQHPNIVRYLGSGLDEEGFPYLALEWLEGEDLHQRQQRAPLKLHEVVEWALQALEGIGFCHGEGVVHRDLKPANLFLAREGDQTRVKVLDFGLVRLGDDAATRLTRDGQLMGTLYYLSPEQCRGAHEVDQRSDLYSMGVILYELCTGRLPFTGDQALAVLLKIVNETPPRPCKLRGDLPPWLEEVILKAMQRASSDRFASARAMQQALSQQSLSSTSDMATMANVDLAALANSATMAPADPELAHSATMAPQEASLASELLGSSAELRLVSLLCVQPVSLDLGLERRATAIIEQHQGVVQRFLGGQLVGLFGLERSSGDEAQRAVKAGLVLREELGRQARYLAATLRVEVKEGLRLSPGELEQTVGKLGALPPGELVMDQGTQQLAGFSMATKRVGTHSVVLGIDEGMQVASRKVLGRDVPLVGRESELATLRAIFYRALDNEEPEVALIEGEVGLGKSRLLNELLPELQQHCPLCLMARADSAHSRSPFALFCSAVAQQAGVNQATDSVGKMAALQQFLHLHAASGGGQETVTFIGEALHLNDSHDTTPALRVARGEPQVMQERVARAFEDVLKAASEQGPVALCFEDLHWADAESLTLCERILTHLEEVPIIVLGTTRPSLSQEHPRLFEEVELTRVRLKQLRKRPLRRLLHAILGNPCSEDAEQLVRRWSEGNPYLVEELTSWLVQSGVLAVGAGGSWELEQDPAQLEVPMGVEGVIQARLDQLPPQSKGFLKALSVVGEVFWEGCADALGYQDPAGLLGQLKQEGHVVPVVASSLPGQQEWRFRQSLMQQVAYRMLPEEERAPVHRGVARWLEQVGFTEADVLAHHFTCAGEQRLAAEYCFSAAERAMADGDLAGALQRFQDSILDELPPTVRARRQMGLARAQLLMGCYAEAAQTVEQLEASLGSGQGPRTAAELTLLKGRALYAQGQFQLAEQVLSAALEQHAAVSDLHFEFSHKLFCVIWAQARYADAGAVAKKLYAAAIEDCEPNHLFLAKLDLSYFHVVRGDLSAALTLAAEAIDHAREIGHPFHALDAMVLLASAQQLVGKNKEALQVLQEAEAEILRLKSASPRASNVYSSQGQVLVALERPEEAVDRFTQAMKLAEKIGDQRALAIALIGMAHAELESEQSGAVSRATVLASRALEVAAGQLPPDEAEAEMLLSRISLLQHDLEEAVEHAIAAMSILDRLGTQERCEVEILLVAHDALTAAGREGEASQMLKKAMMAVRTRTRRINDPEVQQSFAALPQIVRVQQLWEQQ